MDNMNIRFSDSTGTKMVKFCDDHILVSFREEGFLLPYECISKISYSGLLLEIVSNEGVNYGGVKIDEELAIQTIIDKISNKINKRTGKKRQIIPLSEEDIRFIDAAKKAKTGKQLTEEENAILGDFVEKRDEKAYKVIKQNQNRNLILLGGILFLIATAVSLFGGFLLANNYILLGEILFGLGALIPSLFISSHTKKISFGVCFIITIIIIAIINFALFGSPQKTESDWSQLTEEEKEEIKDNMDFFDDVKDAIKEYEGK